MQDRSIDAAKGSLLSLPILAGLVALVVVPHWLLWGENPLGVALKVTNLWTFLLIFTAGVVLHEGIHGITWAVAGRLRASEVKFGFLWKTFTPYAHTRVPIPARAYRIGAAMPGVVLGVLPALAGIISGSAILSGWAAVFLSAACGDLLVLFFLGDLPGDTLVQDHPTRFGCEIVGQREGTAQSGIPHEEPAA